MTDKTATQNLTRTQSTDDPRQLPGYLTTLRDEVDRRMAAQYYQLGRAQQFPAALIRASTQAISSLDAKPNIEFDTVAFDTQGDLVDLGESPYRIKLNSPGWWVVGAYASCTGWPPASGDMILVLESGSSTRTVGFHDGNLGFVGGSFSVMESTNYPLTEECSLAVSFSGTMPGGSEGSTLTFAEMWAYKVRDL